MPQDPENWEQQENIKKTISSRKRPNVDATRAAGSPGKSAAMIQQASRNSAASTRNKETAKTCHCLTPERREARLPEFLHRMTYLARSMTGRNTSLQCVSALANYSATCLGRIFLKSTPIPAKSFSSLALAACR